MEIKATKTAGASPRPTVTIDFCGRGGYHPPAVLQKRNAEDGVPYIGLIKI